MKIRNKIVEIDKCPHFALLLLHPPLSGQNWMCVDLGELKPPPLALEPESSVFSLFGGAFGSEGNSWKKYLLILSLVGFSENILSKEFKVESPHQQ